MKCGRRFFRMRLRLMSPRSLGSASKTSHFSILFLRKAIAFWRVAAPDGGIPSP